MSKVLVVDNSPDFQKTLSGLLTDAGHSVWSVASEGEAMTAITREPFDFALIDVRLHEEGEDDESGFSLAMAVRALDPQVRIILLTRYVRAKQVVRAIQYHGIVDFIDKTMDVGQHVLIAIAKAQADPPKLRQILVEHFSESELRDLCHDLGIDYESLPGDGKSSKARELVAHFERRGQFSKLVDACYLLRPYASWWGPPGKKGDRLPPRIPPSQQSRFQEAASGATRLSFALAVDRPIVVRAHGHYVCSAYTSKTLHVSIQYYSEKTNAARRDPSHLRFHVKDIGCNLWRDIFAEHFEAGRAYLEARAKSLSLSLLFEGSREFLAVPLEFMCSDEPQEYLILQHPLARFLCGVSPKREVISPQMLALTKNLHVLIIASNTLPPIDGADAEARELDNFLRNQNFVKVKFIPTERATYESVREELKEGGYDIVHYAGHSIYEAQSPEESGLYFWAEENKQGGVVPMKATELKMLLERSGARLVYLSSCYGAATGNQSVLLDNDFLGLADAIVQAGVPSVLGFRWPASDTGARRLAMAFYRSLLEQGRPEIALWNARCELAIDRNDTTWLSPILVHQT